jgi:hypothetical protein
LRLPGGREGADAELGSGDIVLVYQSKTGRTEVRKRANGSIERTKRTGAGSPENLIWEVAIKEAERADIRWEIL